MSQDEVVYFQDLGITITNARAVLGAKSYAMANITSVGMGHTPANRTPGVIVALLGVAFGGCLATASDSATGALIFGLVLLLSGVAIAASAKSKYAVRIGSASGESDALSSDDREHIQKIVNALNEAIVKRG